MIIYQVEKRKRYPSGSFRPGYFAIFLQDGCWLPGGRLDLAQQLDTIQARSRNEALRLAAGRGLGAGRPIWAIETVEPERVSILRNV